MDGPRATVPMIVVTGSPASGKTTLAMTLRRELGYPLLQRDRLKEVLFDKLGAADRAESQRLGTASWALLWAMLDQLVGRAPVIVESNFSRGRDEWTLMPYLADTLSVVLHCDADMATLQARIMARNAASGRHPSHHDLTAWLENEHRIRDGFYELVELPCPTLRIDTTDGLDPDLPAILEFARTAGQWDFDPDGY